MAICQYCKKDMRVVSECTANQRVRFLDGESAPAIPHHDTDHPCGDCGVAPGKPHHPGCDLEDCPRCEGQLISCGCADAALEEECE